MAVAPIMAVVAFPGAEGYGKDSLGGRGGKVYVVSNMGDGGPGSLRECVEASGPRTCVFEQGGLIVVKKPLTISSPYITIAGQSAPGGGVTIKTENGGDVFLTKTHDVVMRYITVRPGPGGENHANQIADNGKEISNIIVDHSTFSWGVDSNIETWYRVNKATIQWSMISEGLNNSTHSKGLHSKGLMIGGYKGGESGGIGSENISVLHNLLAHNSDRNPLIQMCGYGQVINNTTYNAQYTFSHQQLNCPAGMSYVNWVGNYHKKGPSSESSNDLKVIPEDGGKCHPGKVYVSGNIGPGRSEGQPETNWVSFNSACNSQDILTTIPATGPTVTTKSAMVAYDELLAAGGAGNSWAVDCNGTGYARRDLIDERVIGDVRNGKGKIIDNPDQVGGWAVPIAGVACVDLDKDGMPDNWESSHRLTDSSGDADGDGYTNLEEYLNGTDPGGGGNGVAGESRGDASGDGKVDLVDFSVWKSGYLYNNSLAGDFDKNGVINLVDFSIWKQAYLQG